jgi:hypothetical protein
MKETQSKFLPMAGYVLVFLMAALQLVYALYAFTDPAAFSVTRGTQLLDLGDSDWVRIYASRTLFIALIVGYLLYLKQFKILVIASLFGTIMPIADAWLAYQASAGDKVIFKHVATMLFLVVTAIVLSRQIRATREFAAELRRQGAHLQQ